MAQATQTAYVCPRCFDAAARPFLHHGLPARCVHQGSVGALPLMSGGRVRTRAPRWFIDYRREVYTWQR